MKNRTAECCVCGNEILFYAKDNMKKKCPFCGTLQQLNGKYAEEVSRDEFYGRKGKGNTGKYPQKRD